MKPKSFALEWSFRQPDSTRTGFIRTNITHRMLRLNIDRHIIEPVGTSHKQWTDDAGPTETTPPCSSCFFYTHGLWPTHATLYLLRTWTKQDLNAAACENKKPLMLILEPNRTLVKWRSYRVKLKLSFRLTRLINGIQTVIGFHPTRY